MIAAIVLAAGKSERMGRPKMSLPWGKITVLGTVLHVLESAGIEEIFVITGAAKGSVEEICARHGIGTILNSAFAEGDMLSSIQTGIKALKSQTRAALIVLGDQPQIRVETVKRVLEAYERTATPLVVPSHNMRRGHPWLVERELWPQLLQLTTDQTAREFLRQHASQIHYVEIDSASILEDLDTPDDYALLRPQPEASDNFE